MMQYVKLLDVRVPLRNFFDKFWLQKSQLIDVKKSLIIANTNSRGYNKAFRRYLLKRFAKIYNLEVKYIKSKSDFRKISVKKYNSIFIASGDGFFNAVLNDKRFADKALGFFPLGAGNALYPYLYGMLPFLSLRLKRKFSVKEIDVMRITYSKQSVETLFASIGFDAEFVKFDNNRSTSSRKDFMNCAKKVLLHKMPITDILIKHNTTETKERNVLTAVFGKMPYYGYRIKSMPFKVHANDSNVYLCSYKGTPLHNMNKLLRIAHITPIPYIKNPIIKKIVDKQIEISSKDSFPLQYAGEFAGYHKRVLLSISRKQKILVSQTF